MTIVALCKTTKPTAAENCISTSAVISLPAVSMDTLTVSLLLAVLNLVQK